MEPENTDGTLKTARGIIRQLTWTHLVIFNVGVWGDDPDFLHNGWDEVVGLIVLGAELFATLWASYTALGPPPVLADAKFAKVMHAGQHHRLPEQITTHGACQILSQTAFGECGGRDGVRSRSRSRSHGEGQLPLLGVETKPWRKRITAPF